MGKLRRGEVNLNTCKGLAQALPRTAHMAQPYKYLIL